MTKVLLLISKIEREFTHTQVKCSICPRDGIDNESAQDQIFLHPGDLADALRAAGVADEDAHAPFYVIENGLPTFIPVTREAAMKLGVLVERAQNGVIQT